MGEIVHLAPQVIELLIFLAERPGRVVARSELQGRLWTETFTDRERGLNNAINRLREALGDSAADAKWIETVPKRGYRFIGKIETVGDSRQARWLTPVAIVVAASGVLFLFLRFQLFRSPTGPLSAPSEYWEALNAIRRSGPGDLITARNLLQVAIRKIPDCGPAYAELAPLLLDLVDMSAVPAAEGRAQAVLAARSALRFSPQSPGAHVAMASVLLRVDWRIREAEREVNEALRLDPKSADAWRNLATVLLAHGKADVAVQAAERSVSLDPGSAIARTASGRALFYSHDASRSAERLQQATLMNPSFGPAHHYLSEVYWHNGQERDARREFLLALRLGGIPPEELIKIEDVSGRAGLVAYWRSELRDLDRAAARQGVPYKLSLRLLEIGEHDESLRWLERAFDQRDVRLLFLRVNPQFDSLRGSPKFESLIARLPVSL